MGGGETEYSGLAVIGRGFLNTLKMDVFQLQARRHPLQIAAFRAVPHQVQMPVRMKRLHFLPNIQQAIHLFGRVRHPSHIKNGVFLPGKVRLNGIISQQVGNGVQPGPFRGARQLEGVFRIPGGEKDHLVRSAEHIPVFPPLVADGRVFFTGQQRMAQQRFHGIAPGGEILPEQAGEIIQPCADVKGNPGNDGSPDVKVFMAEEEGVILIGPAVDDAVRLLCGA